MTDNERHLIFWLIMCAVALVYVILDFMDTRAENKRLADENTKLVKANAKLKDAVRLQKAEYDDLKKQLAQPSSVNITALKQTILIQQEALDNLRKQVALYKNLLNQKWTGAKKNAHVL